MGRQFEWDDELQQNRAAYSRTAAARTQTLLSAQSGVTKRTHASGTRVCRAETAPKSVVRSCNLCHQEKFTRRFARRFYRNQQSQSSTERKTARSTRRNRCGGDELQLRRRDDLEMSDMS